MWWDWHDGDNCYDTATFKNAKVLHLMVQKTEGDIGEDVKETKLGFYWAERDTAEERGRDGGECEGGEMEKEEKKLPTSFDLQQHSLFPTVPTSGKYATYKKQQQHVAFKHHVTTVGGTLPWQPSHSFPLSWKQLDKRCVMRMRGLRSVWNRPRMTGSCSKGSKQMKSKRGATGLKVGGWGGKPVQQLPGGSRNPNGPIIPF